MAITYLRTPVYRGTNVAGQTAMVNGQPYVMRGASSGVATRTLPNYVQGRPVTEDDISNARNAQAQAVATVGNYTPDGIQINKVRQGWLSNQNPELRGGIAEVSVNGKPIRVPNALLQQMMFTDAWNQGRSNEVGDFFNGRANPDPKTYGYTNYDATQQRFDKILAANPQWTNDAPLNPYKAAEEKAQAAAGRYQKIMDQMGQPMKESRAAGGQFMGGDTMGGLKSEADKALAEAQSYSPELNARRGRYFGELQGTRMLEAQRKAFEGGVKPTYSNLPIQERIIK